jgi:transposase
MKSKFSNKHTQKDTQEAPRAEDARPARLYVGLDIGVRKTQCCMITEHGKLVRETKISTHPKAVGDWMRKHGSSNIEHVVLETGSMSAWLHRNLRAQGFPVVVLSALQVHRILSSHPNKTDKKDARGLAELARKGIDWLTAVHVKSAACQDLRSLLTVRSQFVKQRMQNEAILRGILKQNGEIIDNHGRTDVFHDQAIESIRHAYLNENIDLSPRLLPILELCRDLRARTEAIDRELEKLARSNPVCRRFLDIPGVGPVVAISFYTAIEDPHRFRQVDDVAAYLGLTPRLYQSGEKKYDTVISLWGNRMTRTHLVQAANIILTHTKEWSSLKSWGVRLSHKIGFNKAKIAVARKLAVIMLAMWRDNLPFCHREEIYRNLKAHAAAA